MADFDPEILQDFLTESGELLEQLEGDLVTLEDTPSDPDLLNQIFRALHTIKGSASFLALTNLVAIAHAAESALNSARSGSVTVDQAMMDMLLESVDLLKVQFDELSGGESLTEPPAALVSALTMIGEGTQPAQARAAVDGGGGGGAVAVAAAADAGGSGGASGGAAGASSDGAGEDSGAVDGGGRRARPLVLDGARADLFEPFVMDVDETLDKIKHQLGQLVEDTGAGGEIAALARDLTTTVDFFEFAEMSDLAGALAEAAETALVGESVEACLPRVRAVVEILQRQADGLRNNQMVTWPTGTLLSRLREGGEGLPPGVGLDEVLRIDGVEGVGNAGGAVSLEASAAASVSAVAAGSGADGEAGAVACSPAGGVAAEASPAAGAAVGGGAKKAESGEDGEKKSVGVEQTIRVEVTRLEALMNLVGELVLQKNRMSALSRRVASGAAVDADLAEQFELSATDLDRVTGDMQVAVMRTRMQPLDKLFGKYPRLIRDLSKKTGKKIRLAIEGGETEVDKSVIEELGDPLVHIMRNSADHGLEPPEERVAAGKDETGTITLRAQHDGGHVRIQIIDNGRGLNREKLAAKAVERGLTTPEQAASMSDREVFDFIMQPGFSTADQVSDLSGRGVGMDVVRTNIERLKGTIAVSSEPGNGTTMTITIPLTIAIMPAMMVGVGEEIYAVPLGSILEIVRPGEREISTVGGSPVMRLRDDVLPLVSAADVFGVRTSSAPEFAVVLRVNDRSVGLMVSRVIGQQEIVIKPLDGMKTGGAVSGATVRDDGDVSLIIDVSELVRRAQSGRQSELVGV